MSRQRLKILAAGAILAAGFAVAIVFFRQVGSRPLPNAGEDTKPVVLRQSFEPHAEEESATPHLSGRIEPITAAAPGPAPASAPVSAPEASAPLSTSPPQMADHYQSAVPGGDAGSPTDPFQAAVERKPATARPSGSQPKYRRHVIRDGDTLAGLAERYLGSAARKSEILALNRDTLRSSDELPIGAVLRIPPAPAGLPAASVAPIAVPPVAPPLAPEEEPLVPVPAAAPPATPVVSASAPAPESPVTVPPSAQSDGWRPAPASP